MRRLTTVSLLVLALAPGCARGTRTLVQSFRIAAPQSGLAQSLPAGSPNELTPRERALLNEAPDPSGPRRDIVTTAPSNGSRTQAVSQSELPWRRDYESADRRAIETLRLGSGDQRIAVMSSLHGNELDTIRALEAAIAQLSTSKTPLTDRAVLAIRTPNPDGAADRTMTNARGVDLNRNFPSVRFPANASKLTGETPASEPETRALIQILADFRPTRVIHITSGGSLRGAVIANFDAKAIDGFDPLRIDQVRAASVEDYAVTRLKVEVVNLVLPASRDQSATPASVRQIVTLLTDQAPAAANAGIAAESRPAARDGNPIRLEDEIGTAAPAGQAQPRPDGMKGYVQFLPEPPGFRAIPTNNGDGARYFELPPPE